MRTSRMKFLVGICSVLLVLNLIPLSYSQSSYYQSYFWISDTGNQLSAIQVTGDLDSDHVQLSEIVVSGAGNVTLIDGFYGTIICNYSISPTLTYNALAVGNLDSDALNEIVAGSLDGNLTTALKYNTSTEKFTLLWEKNYNVTQLAVSDITGDLLNDVVIGDVLGNLTVLDQNGTFVWSFDGIEPIVQFKCVDLSQNGTIDGVLVLTETYVTLINTTGLPEWQVGVTSEPLNAVLGDVYGNDSLEILIKGQEVTYAFTQNGTILWNSTPYLSESGGIMPYDYIGSSKSEILIACINGSYFLNGTDGSILKKYLSNSSITSFGISNFFDVSTNYLVMGDFDNNLTLWELDGTYLYNITLSGAVIDIILEDMNADGVLDIVSASTNGSVFVIGLPWMIDFTWVIIGILIGAGVIIATFVIVIKMRPPGPSEPKKELIKF